MGGFEGGDEGGYWEVEVIPNILGKQKSKNNTNIEIKDGIYSIKSFVKLNNLSDIISIVESEYNTFTIEGCDKISLESNSIYKAYESLIDFTEDSDIIDFFKVHKIVIEKNIRENLENDMASSNVASFLLLSKEACNLALTDDELIQIANNIAIDITLFLKNSKSN